MHENFRGARYYCIHGLVWRILRNYLTHNLSNYNDNVVECLFAREKFRFSLAAEYNLLM